MAVQTAGGAGCGDRIGDEQIVGDPHRGIARLRDEGVDAHTAAVGGVGVAGRLGGLTERVAHDGVVGDLRVGLVDVHAAAEHQSGVAEHQVVGDGDGAVDHDPAAAEGGPVADDDISGHDCADVAVDAQTAALADLPLGDVIDDGVGLDAGMSDDRADAVPLDMDAAAGGQRVGGAAEGGRVDDVPGDGVADDDRVAVADVDATADPVGLGAGHQVAGDDVVADDGVA